MRKLIIATVSVALMAWATGAEAKGCIKGALVGAIAGHYAGHHAFLGAAAGCALGRHLANQPKPSQPVAHGQAEPDRRSEGLPFVQVYLGLLPAPRA